MMAKTRSERILLDLAMTILLIWLMTYSLLGERAHEWLGIALLLLLVLHQSWNIGWWRRLFSGRYTPCRALRTALTVLLFMSLLGSMASGVFLSQYVLDGFPLRSGGELARAVHLPCAYWSFCLTGLHLGLHWSTVAGLARRVRKAASSPPAAWGCRILAVLAAACGAWAFLRYDFPSYLLLRTHFVFWEEGQTFPRVFADYLAITGLLACAGYYGGRAVRFLERRRTA